MFYKTEKWHALAMPAIFTGLLFAFYPELILAKQGPLVSDHLEQHYPWFSLLWNNLNSFSLPLWSPLIQTGFPIAAESQVGIFYLPNLILSVLLPLNWAYSWLMVIHFLLAGLSTYAYSREMRLARISSLTAAIVFVFGSAYGGAYYNITSLKTISWLPFLLFIFERSLKFPKFKYFMIIAVCSWQCLVAGYLQVAILTLFFYTFYCILRYFFLSFEWDPKRKIKIFHFIGMLFSGLGALLLSLPQILMTFQLAMLSNRAETVLDYAYVGSLSPMALSTLIFPHFQGLFRGNCLYGGVTALLFVIAAFHTAKKAHGKFILLWTILALTALFMGLGRWSPLYIAFVKLTQFSSFRTPAKYLIFFNFAFSFLAAAGVDNLVRLKDEPGAQPQNFSKPLRTFSIFVSTMIASLIGLWILFTHGSSRVLKMGEWFVHKFIYGQPGHPHSWEIYEAKLQSMLSFSKELLYPVNPWNLLFFAIIGICFVVYRKWAPARIERAVLLLLGLLVIELYAFSWKDLRQDFARYSSLTPPGPIVENLIAARENGKLLRIYGYRKRDESLPILPSTNMLYGIADIGAYSPLLMSRYYQSIGRLGNVNDSNLVQEPSTEYVRDRLALLSSIGVSHIVSTTEIHSPELSLIPTPDSSVYLYKNIKSPKLGYFSSHYNVLESWEAVREQLMSSGFNPESIVLFEQGNTAPPFSTAQAEAGNNSSETLFLWNDSHVRWNLKASSSGVFVCSQTWYPGWQVFVNGVEKPLLRAHGLFQSVYIDGPGEYTIDFKYSLVAGIKALFRHVL